MKGREVREGREREGRGEIQPQQQAKQSKAKKKEEEEEEEEVRPKRERGKKGVPKWKAHTLVPTPQGAVNTHKRRKRKEEMSFFFPLFLLSLPIGHSKHKQTKRTQQKKDEEEKQKERDAHRLVVDKKEGEQSHGKRGKGEKMR